MFDYFIVLFLCSFFTMLFLLLRCLIVWNNTSDTISVMYLDNNTSNTEYAIKIAYMQNRFFRTDIPLILVDGGIQGESREISGILSLKYGIPIIDCEKFILYLKSQK